MTALLIKRGWMELPHQDRTRPSVARPHSWNFKYSFCQLRSQRRFGERVKHNKVLKQDCSFTPLKRFVFQKHCYYSLRGRTALPLTQCSRAARPACLQAHQEQACSGWTGIRYTAADQMHCINDSGAILFDTIERIRVKKFREKSKRPLNSWL